MSKSKVTIIDYGMGNLWSVLSAFHYLEIDANIASDPEGVINADTLVLPGVGSFRNAMGGLKKNGLDQAIIEAVKVRGIKILGICLGLQLLGTKSAEDGNTAGLGLIDAGVERFTFEEVGDNKIPHVGFDLVKSQNEWPLFEGLKKVTDFYFVHSYRMLPNGLSGKKAICNYGVDFLAAYEKDNVFATQFHPEKSQSNGILFLKNFMAQ